MWQSQHSARKGQRLFGSHAGLVCAAIHVHLQAHLQRRQMRRPLRREDARRSSSDRCRAPSRNARPQAASCCFARGPDSSAIRVPRAAPKAPRSCPAPLARRSRRRPAALPRRPCERPQDRRSWTPPAAGLRPGCAPRQRKTFAIRLFTCWRSSPIIVIIVPKSVLKTSPDSIEEPRGHHPTAGIQRQERSLRPALVGRAAPDDPRRTATCGASTSMRSTTRRCTPWCTTS